MIQKYDFNDLYNNQLMSLPDLKRFLEKSEGYSIPGYPIKLLELQGIKTRSIKESANTGKRTEKIRNTCLEKYGTVNVLSKGTEMYEKRNQTVKDKYGCDNVFQVKEVKDKIQNTLKEHFGDDYHQIVYEHFSKAYCEKTGYDNPWKNPEVIKKIWEYKAEHNLIVFKKHKISSIHKTVSDWLSFQGIEHINEASRLKIEITHTDGSIYRPVPDIYIPKYNLIVEIYGTYWHADSRVYKDSDMINTFKGLVLAEDIRHRDEDRLLKIAQQGYNTLVLWELDILSEAFKDIFHKNLETLSI